MQERTTKMVTDEKNEDRGWGQYDIPENITPIAPIPPLPLSEEEYNSFSLLLAKLALNMNDEKLRVKLCDVYFELQRCANYGNGYAINKAMESIEQKLWTIGTGERIEEEANIGRKAL